MHMSRLRDANIGGVPLGRAIAQDTFSSGLVQANPQAVPPVRDRARSALRPGRAESSGRGVVHESTTSTARSAANTAPSR